MFCQCLQTNLKSLGPVAFRGTVFASGGLLSNGVFLTQYENPIASDAGTNHQAAASRSSEIESG
jgi:hypothetical protein